MSPTLDIDTLQSLVAIAETMSFSRAAERLGRTQSAISLRISRLEILLGHPVIERSRGRVIRMTARGERLVGHARQIIELNARAVASARQPDASARVKIGIPADFLERDFPGILRKVRSRHPTTHFEVRSDISARLIEALDGGLDLAFFKRLPSNGVGSRVGSESMAWFCGAAGDSLGAQGSSTAVPLVAFAEGCAYRQEAVRALEQAGREWYLACEAQSFPALAAAVEAGLGYAALPARMNRRKALVVTNLRGLPKLQPVELAVGIATGRDGTLMRSIADIIAQHCVAA